MKKILLLLLLTILFAGCKKDDEGNDNHLLVGKWVLYEYRKDDEFNKCNFDGLIDEFGEDGEYFGVLLNGESAVQSNGTYSLKGDELKINKTKFKVLYLSNPQLIVEDISGMVYYLYKPQ